MSSAFQILLPWSVMHAGGESMTQMHCWNCMPCSNPIGILAGNPRRGVRTGRALCPTNLQVTGDQPRG